MVEVQRLWGRPFLHSSKIPQMVATRREPATRPFTSIYRIYPPCEWNEVAEIQREAQRSRPRCRSLFSQYFSDFGKRGTLKGNLLILPYPFRSQMKSLDSLCRLPIARTACCRIFYRNPARSFHSSRGLLSGHNKWSTIKHKKGIVNARRILILIL